MFPLSLHQRAVVEMLRPDAGGDAALWRRAPVDWTAALAFANAHYVGPALHASLSGAGRTGELPADANDYLALLRANNLRRNRRLARQARELAAALNRAGIRPLLVKGAMALVEGAPGDPGTRMLRDIDLLVPARDAHAAVATLRRLGYAPLTRYPEGHHAYGDFARRGEPGAVDLHFELTDMPHVLGADEVRGRARAIDWRGAAVLVPCPTDAALHNVLHAQVHYLGGYYRGELELRQLLDFAGLARLGVDWRFVADRLSAHGLRAPLESHALAAHHLLAVPWPLPRPSSPRAALHLRRCLAQQRLPALARLGLPWANLRRGLARHRMDGLYADGRPLTVRRLQHLRGVLKKGGLRFAVDRLLRAR